MSENENPPEYLKGRGAQYNAPNRFMKLEYVQEHIEALDEPLLSNTATEYIEEFPKKIVNKVNSPDLPMPYSMNPYQGCEHGCIYCYARNTHQYWGYSAGLDFERKVIVKKNAPELLANTLRKKNWKPAPIMLSGNTDCYQPIERKLEITRKMLEILLEYRHPVGVITKNSLILRDLDLLAELASMQLVKVSMSITTLDEKLRLAMEPRTATGKQRLKAIEKLSAAGIPVNVMVAPIIPGLNNHEIVSIMEAAANAGASSAGFTMVRLNGPVGEVFTDWIHKTLPDRADKVLSQIAESHGGSLSDSRYGTRMRGEGPQAEAIRDLFRMTKTRLFEGRESPPYNLDAFCPPDLSGQLRLF
jgi:DNA repair photolyase